jgi:hypothetical protein
MDIPFSSAMILLHWRGKSRIGVMPKLPVRLGMSSRDLLKRLESVAFETDILIVWYVPVEHLL